MTVVGPPLEFHLGDERRLDPGSGRVQLRLLREWIGLALERIEERLDALDRALVESRADMRGVAQLAALPIAEQQRPERRARSLACRVAADHEIRRIRSLHLEPGGRAAAGIVDAVLALAYDALEAGFHRRL